MTIAITTGRWPYLGDGLVTDFPFTALIHAAADLRVTVDGALQTLGVHYTVTLGEPSGGVVHLTPAPLSGALVVIVIRPALLQDTDLTNVGPFAAEAVSDQFDKHVNQMKGLSERIDRCPILPETSALTEVPFPVPTGKPLYYLRVNAAGTGYELVQVVITEPGALTLPLAIAQGGTGTDNVTQARANLGLTLPLSMAGGTVSPLQAQLVVLATHAEAPNARVLAAAGKLSLTDGGAGQPITLTAALPRSYLAGLAVSNSAGDVVNDLDIAVGEARSDDNTTNLLLATAMTKQLDAAWAAGTAAGGRIASESLADGTWYVFVFLRSGGAVDVCFSQSLSPTLPDGGTKRRRVWSFLRESGTIAAFTAAGDLCEWITVGMEHDITNPGATAVLRALRVPLGMAVRARYNAVISTTSLQLTSYFSNPAVSDQAPSLTVGPLHSQSLVNSSHVLDGHQLDTLTNTSGQIRTRLTASDAGTRLRLSTLGYLDRRGRDD